MVHVFEFKLKKKIHKNIDILHIVKNKNSRYGHLFFQLENIKQNCSRH